MSTGPATTQHTDEELSDMKCPGCGYRPEGVTETKPNTSPPGSSAPIPSLVLLYCPDCGYWMAVGESEFRRFLLRDVPDLEPWVAFFMGSFMHEAEKRRRAHPALDLSEALLRILASSPPGGKRAKRDEEPKKEEAPEIPQDGRAEPPPVTSAR